MFKNYLSIFLRGFHKAPLFSILNIAGLALGIACATLIFLYVEDEVSFDRQYAHRDQIYSIRMNIDYINNIESTTSVPWPMEAAVRAEVPEVVNATHFTWARELLASNADPNPSASRNSNTGPNPTANPNKAPNSAPPSATAKTTYEWGAYVDTGFFRIFPPIFLKGNATGFTSQYTVILTATTAKKFFGSSDPVGKTLRIDNAQDFTIIAVVKDPPSNTSITYNWIMPVKNFYEKNRWLAPWSGHGIATILKLQPGTNIRNIEKQLTAILQPKDRAYAHTTCILWSINDWHLRSLYTNGKPDGGRIVFIDLISAIAWIIMIIACINFMNLATARAGKRAREVGVRKTLGAIRLALIRQFILESMLMSLLAVVLSILLVYLALPSFNTLADKNLSFHPFTPVHITALVIITVFCGLIAGSYPAFYLSAFNPVNVLKGQITALGGRNTFIRKALVVTQFTMSVVLIISTIIIYQQIAHVRSRDLGYNKEHLLYAHLQGDLADHFDALKADLLQTGVVANVSLSKSPALSMWVTETTQSITWPGADPRKKVKINAEWVTPEYFSTLGLQMVKGRGFYPDIKANRNTMVINEALAELMGKQGYVGNYLTYDSATRFRIVGIVKNFLFNDMYAPIVPLMITCEEANKQNFEFMQMRLKSGRDLAAGLAKVEAVVRTHNPGYPFEYTFADQEFDNRFTVETRIGKLAATFSVLAIFISCLGLFGLAAYTAERRTREIGIRRVFGASTFSLTRLLTREYIQLVSLSCGIAFPIAWIFMYMLLKNFPYRTAIHWWIFAGAGMAALFIALLTVGSLTVRAALANPINSLRTE